MITRKLILKEVSWKVWKACSLHFNFWNLPLMLASSIKGLLWKTACLEAWLVGSQGQDMLLSCSVCSISSSIFLLCWKVSLTMSSSMDLSSIPLPFIRPMNKDIEAASVYFLWKYILTRKCIQAHSVFQHSVDLLFCKAVRWGMREKLYCPFVFPLCVQSMLWVTGVTFFLRLSMRYTL